MRYLHHQARWQKLERSHRVVILWVGNARKIPNAVLGSVGRVERQPTAIIPDIGRHFPPPWSAEVQPNCYVVRDANGQQIAYIYYSNDPERRTAAKLLSKDEARRIAANKRHVAGAIEPPSDAWRAMRRGGRHSPGTLNMLPRLRGES